MTAAAPQTATQTQPNRHLAAAAELWDRMLTHIPTQLGKLISVASFRTEISGEYQHPNLDRVLTSEVARRVLRESHEHLFAEWVGLFPEEQVADATRYLAALQQKNARDLLLKAGESLIPDAANSVARHTFLSDLEAILILTADKPAPGPQGGPKTPPSSAWRTAAGAP
jgi:hypothetical protein